MKKLSLFVIFLLMLNTIALAQEETVDPGITPDSPILYGLDRAFERISLALTFNRAAKAEKRLKIASERIAELKTMVEKGKPEFAEKLAKEHDEEIEEVEKDIEKARALGQNTTALSVHVAEMTSKHIAVLQRVLEKAPDSAKPALQKVIEKATNKSLTRVIKTPKTAKKPEENESEEE